MPLDTLFTVTQVLLSLLLIAAILLQNRGAGLGQTFGGDSAIYHTKRGLEKRLHQGTAALAIAFLTVAVLQLIF
jgi:preprotein translocase subunit SecG